MTEESKSKSKSKSNYKTLVMRFTTIVKQYTTSVLQYTTHRINILYETIVKEISNTNKSPSYKELDLTLNGLIPVYQYIVDILLFQKMLFSMFVTFSYYKLTHTHSPYLIDILYLDITRNGCIPIKLT